MSESKIIMISQGQDKLFGGRAVYGSGDAEGPGGLIRIEDAVQFIPTIIPQQNGLQLLIFCTKIGTILDFPTNTLIVELSPDSEYYKTWLQVTSNLVTPPHDMPTLPQRHRR